MTNNPQSLKLIKNALENRYEIKELIGSGGMAEVYKAVQTTLGREVAIKIVHQNLVHDKEFVTRFIKEARVAAALNHPNIITIHDVDSIDTVHYMTMELLDGEALNQRIRRKGKLGLVEMLKIIIPVAQALNYLHKKGYIHRDVKSSNIFINKEGRPVLTDFGIVYTSESMLSQPGTVLGTPEFMSPEQAAGKNRLDGRSDLYSLGVIMYECVTGQMPFRTDNPLTTVYKVINEAPIEPMEHNPTVPKWLNSQILNLLSKDPGIRVRSGNLLANNLLQKKILEYSFKPPTKEYVPDPLTQQPVTGKFSLEAFESLDNDFVDPETMRMAVPPDLADGLKTQVRRQKKKNNTHKILLTVMGFVSVLFIAGALYLAKINADKRNRIEQEKIRNSLVLTNDQGVQAPTFTEPVKTKNTPNEAPDYIYTIVDEHPQFPGGVIAFNQYIQSNLEFPVAAIGKVRDEKVLVSFVVETDGSISNVKVIKGLGYGCDEEAVRLISTMPKFIPGVRNGQQVRVKLIFSVLFSRG